LLEPVVIFAAGSICVPPFPGLAGKDTTMKIIKIKDYYGQYQEVPVSDELYAEWVKLNNETQRVYRKEVYHRNPIPLSHAAIIVADRDDSSLADVLIKKEETELLYDAISKLTPIQRHRVMLYMDNMSCTDIARSEKRKYAPVYRSLQVAFKKLRTALKDYEEDKL
jgi:DNA-directed RNA polymerase specialized sigma24 family protein